MDIPKTVNKVKVRSHGDGTFTLIRNNRKAEAWLDAHFARVSPQGLTWCSIVPEPEEIIEPEGPTEPDFLDEDLDLE